MINFEFSESVINEFEYNRYNFPDPKVQRKMEVLYLKSQNLNHDLICRLCRISSVTLVKYLRQYQDGGIERLKINLYKGKTNELNSHKESLETILTKNPPHTTKEAAQIIEDHTGIKRGITQVREFLKSMGFKYRKTATIPGKATTDDFVKQQEDFKANKLEPILDEAKKGKSDVFFWMPPTSYTDPS